MNMTDNNDIFKNLKSRTNRVGRFTDLLNKMVDTSYEGRERDTSQKSMKNRVNDSLMMVKVIYFVCRSKNVKLISQNE